MLNQGAEAKIYLKDGSIVKDRFAKSYRLPELDRKLRKSRTKREAKIMKDLPINSPKIFEVDLKEMKISMEYIKGDKVRDILDDNVDLAYQIGIDIAKLHDNDIIHGDLTTSNMILDNDLYFIDFGLAVKSSKIEDKAVDLHLLKQALESKHYKIAGVAFKKVIKGYKTSFNSDAVLKRLEKVESRGRHKKK